MNMTHADKAEEGQSNATQSGNSNHALLLAVNANTSALLAIYSQLERIADMVDERV